MTVIQSLGSLQTVGADWFPSTVRGSLSLYSDYSLDYATIYRTQPNVRTVVEFLSRNVAQLGIHLFRRVSDTDRVRLAGHPMAQTLERPTPRTTRYRLIESTMMDLGIYHNAFWLKVRIPARMALLRVPPIYIRVLGTLEPSGYRITFPGRDPLDFEPSEIVHFRGPNPESATTGLSPLETLRRTLAEENAAGENREWFWNNAARKGGVIERPLDAPVWSVAARERFTADFESLYSGASNSGKTAILEDGMVWKDSAFSPRDSEYIESRKLTREEVARSYHIPLPMVGILDHATFSNISEQHKNLYQDCLAPWLVMMQEDLELQLLPDFGDVADVYLEFNIAAKLAGSFEEQAASLSTSVGRPWMTANEARARQNLPSLDGDADQLVTPLNVIAGGQASPRDSAPPKDALSSGRKSLVNPEYPRIRKRHVDKWSEVLSGYFGRQLQVVLGSLPKARKAAVTIDDLFDVVRWDRELASDLERLGLFTAGEFARRVAAQIDLEFDDDDLIPTVRASSAIAAEGINRVTRAQIVAAMREDDPKAAISHLYDIARSSRSTQIGQTKTTQWANYGSTTAAVKGGLKTKTWRVNSGNPRSQHAELAGEQVGIGERFGNGMLWPGDPSANVGADQTANCECSVEFD